VVKQRLYDYIQKKNRTYAYFETADTKAYREQINAIIIKAMQGRLMKFAMGKVIFHNELTRKTYDDHISWYKCLV
jgi:hypothetical protein